MSIVHCKIPKSGLGNQLFPLMKAHVFGHLNRMPVIVTGYHQFKIGPYLRREKIKRNYSDYFTFQKRLIGAWIESQKLRKFKDSAIVKEPLLESIDAKGSQRQLYEYNAIPGWADYFGQLREHRELVIRLFHSLLRKSIVTKTDEQQSPCIGVHIRMGDFRKLRQGEDFKSTGAVRTPEEYFIEMINQIREINGTKLPVSVFTDGYRHELGKLLAMDKVKMIEGNPDIVDMLLLSRSKIIVASAGSTFSYWAGFLADAPLIMHPDHIHQPTRPSSVNTYFYEGALLQSPVSGLLEKNIRASSE